MVKSTHLKLSGDIPLNQGRSPKLTNKYTTIIKENTSNTKNIPDLCLPGSVQGKNTSLAIISKTVDKK